MHGLCQRGIEGWSSAGVLRNDIGSLPLTASIISTHVVMSCAVTAFRLNVTMQILGLGEVWTRYDKLRLTLSAFLFSDTGTEGATETKAYSCMNSGKYRDHA